MCFKECVAYSVADQIIKANTEALVTVKADTISKPSDVIMFEPYKADELSLREGLVWANSLNNINEDGTITVSVLNTSDNDVLIKIDRRIGGVCELFSIIKERANKSSEPSAKKDWLEKVVVNESLSEKQRIELNTLIEKHKNVFQLSEFDVGLTTKAKHTIDTGNAKPIKQNPYRLPQAA